MKKSREGELAILRSQARQLEVTIDNVTHKSSEFLEEQYHKLRSNLVSLDPNADNCLPDFRRKGFVGSLVIDLAELREKVKIAVHQMNAYLDAELPQVGNKVKTKCAIIEKEINVPEEILQSLPREVRRTIEGILYNYQGDFTNFCFWGMRKALIDAIRIRFMKDRKEDMLYDPNDNPYSLSKWIELAKQEKYISSSTAKALNSQVKVFGDVASHDYMANLQREEIRPVMTSLRMALSRMYYREKE